MKVVHVCLNKTGGAAAAAWRLHLALLQSGVNSWFYTLEPRGAEDHTQQWICWKQPRHSLLKTATALGVRKYWQWKTAARRAALQWLQEDYQHLLPGLQYEMISIPDADKNLLEDELFDGADIIHLHWVTHFIKYHEFFKRSSHRYNICWTLHDLNPVSGLFHYAFDLHRNPQTTSLEQNVIAYKKQCMQDYGKPIVAIAPNAWMLQQIQASAFSGLMQAVEIPYCLPASAGPEISRLQARQQLGMSPTETVLLSVVESTAVARKQAQLIWEVAPLFPQIKWVVAGGHAANGPALSNVQYRGFVGSSLTMQQLYAAANAVVITSAEDNLPNVMLEAFACGTPVLSFAVGGLRQYVVAGKTGYTTTTKTAAGLQQLIQQWMTAVEVDSEGIKAFANYHFNPAQIAQQHYGLYQQMLAQHYT